MAEKKVFTDESLSTFVNEIKTYTDDANLSHNTSTDAHTNMGWLSSEDEVADSPTPFDADTLNGHDSSYFASENNLAVERDRIDKLSNYVTPEMYGAVGDGVTDDSQCFIEMLQDNNNNGVLLNGNKIYYITQDISNVNNKIINLNGSTLKISRTIELCNNNTIFNGTIQSYNNPSYYHPTISIIGADNRLENIDFISNVDFAHYVFTRQNSNITTIRHCSFDGHGERDILLGGKDCLIDRCYFASTIINTTNTSSKANGVKLEADDSLDQITPCARNTKITNCYFGVFVDNSIDCFSGADGLIIDNCIFDSGDLAAIEIKNMYRDEADADFNAGTSVPNLRVCRNIHISNCKFLGTGYMFVASTTASSNYTGDAQPVTNLTCVNCEAPNISGPAFSTDTTTKNVVIDNLVCDGLSVKVYQYLYADKIVMKNCDIPQMSVIVYSIDATIVDSRLNEIISSGANVNLTVDKCLAYRDDMLVPMISCNAGAKVVVRNCDATRNNYLIALTGSPSMMTLINNLARIVVNNGYASSGGNIYLINNGYTISISPADNKTGIVLESGNYLLQ